MASYIYRYRADFPIKVRLVVYVRFVITNTRSAISPESVVGPEAMRDTDEIPCISPRASGTRGNHKKMALRLKLIGTSVSNMKEHQHAESISA